MENKSAFSKFLSKTIDTIGEQTWFQQVKAKWEEVDEQSRTYLKIAAASISVLTVLALVLSSVFSVRAQKKELADKNDLILLIQTANEELRTLKNSAMGNVSPDTGPLSAFFDATADHSGIEHTKMTVSEEKPAPQERNSEKNNPDKAKESLVDVSLKKVNIKQVVRFAFNLENGNRPAKVRNLTIDTQPDQSGYLDATFAVSAFTLKQ